MPDAPQFDWYLQEWCATLDKRQAGLTGELGLHKNTANRLWHGDQPYRRDYVNLISAWLNIRPYELLMPPDEAMAIRRMREDAVRIAAATPPADAAQPAPLRAIKG